MKKRILAGVIAGISVLANLYAEQPPMKLWYDKPATVWMHHALPIGNGELGGMFFGGIEREQMQFNEKTLWTGSKTSRGAYQNFGDVYLNFPASANTTAYRRELNLDEAIGSVSYTSDGVNYLREYFASYPDSVIVMRITTPANSGKLNFSVELSDAHSGTKTVSGNTITVKKNLDLVSCEAQLAVLNEGGSLTSDASKISVANADKVTILLTGATNFDVATTSYLGENAAQLHNRISARIAQAAAKTYAQLKKNHLNDYQPKFSRVKLDFNTEMPAIPTDLLVRNHRESIYLDILYYQYGRYLMLGSSRGMNLPNNLQGIWNDSNNPPWQCDIHSNINIQMNYWPAENTNLSECHLPFLNYVATEAVKTGGSWQSMANSLGHRGWTVKTQNNIFGYSDWNWNRPANAWYCMHLWQHFAYTNDIVYLRQTAFPAMKSACEFWIDRLILDNAGKWVAPQEWSPEQGSWSNGLEDGIAYAQQLIWELFDNTLKAAAVIDADPTFISALQSKFNNLDNGLHIGSWGQIREWKIKQDVQGDTHRHLSHLIALYPGNQISFLRDSAYANAAKTSLISRGDGGTGWSRAWKIACWARLFDGNHAYKLLKAALEMDYHTTIVMENAGGVYENLFDSHPPFQIDGNFGATAGITEMLLQSNLGFIHLLPALPSAWPNGSFDGLKAEGDFTVDLQWKNGLPENCTVYSGSGSVCKLYNKRTCPLVKDEAGNTLTVDIQGDYISFATQAGKKYTLAFSSAKSETSPRQTINFNREWKYFRGNEQGAEQLSYNDTDWETVGLPHSFSIPYFMSKDFYVGYGWYRKPLELKQEDLKNKLFLEFDGVFQEADIFVNGQKIGNHVGGYTGFSIDISAAVRPGYNLLAVRVNNIWKPDVAPRAGEHTFSGGIYRNVRLVMKSPAYIDWYGTFITTPDCGKNKGKSSVVKIATDICNSTGIAAEYTLVTEITDASGKLLATVTDTEKIKAHSTKQIEQKTASIARPQLWHPASPTLYKAISSLYQGEELLDSEETTFGFRWFEWTADKGFFLNGEHLYFKGANVHQDQAGWGDAVTDAAMQRDVRMMKEAGFDFIRGSHYPHAPSFVQACDEQGMMFWSEAPFWGIGGFKPDGYWNSGAYPVNPKDVEGFEASALKQLEEMIRIHRNHPSIIAWSMSNEAFFSAQEAMPGVRRLLKKMVDLTRQLDSTRPAAVGGAQRPLGGDRIDYLGDLAGYNGDGSTQPDFQRPAVPNVVSEYGSTTSDRPGNYIPGWGDLQRNDAWKGLPWRSGQAIWCGFDHGSIAGSRLGKMGIVDYFRIPKRAWYWYRNEYAQIAPPEWPKEGVPAQIRLEASKTSGIKADGTDDVQLTVTILDAEGKEVSNSPTVRLKLIAGAGEFPTSSSITFDKNSDITIADGKAAIAFRSYYAGVSVIEASSEGLPPTLIALNFEGVPAYAAKKAPAVKARPYVRFTNEKNEQTAQTFGRNNPTFAGSQQKRFTAGLGADGDKTTWWQADMNDESPYWMLDTEKNLLIKRINLFFPTNGVYRYKVEVSDDREQWNVILNNLSNTKKERHKEIILGNHINGQFVRISFLPDNKFPPAIADVEIIGIVNS